MDLTMPFSARTIPVPGHPRPELEPLTSLEQARVRNTTMTRRIHTGTHVDAPSHFVVHGETIGQTPIDPFPPSDRKRGV